MSAKSEAQWAFAQIAAGIILAAIAPSVDLWIAEVLLVIAGLIFLALASKVGDRRSVRKRQGIVALTMLIFALIPVYGEIKRQHAAEENKRRDEALLDKAADRFIRRQKEGLGPQPPSPLASVPALAFVPPPAAAPAEFLPIYFRTDFIYRQAGEYLAVVFLALHNPTSIPVNLRIQHQHWPLGWIDPVGPGPAIRLEPRTVTLVSGSSDTVADPRGALGRGEKLYFAYRATWDIPNAALGCKTFFVEIASDGRGGTTGRVIETAPKEITSSPRFAIRPCG